MSLDLHTFLTDQPPWEDRGPDVTVPDAGDRPRVLVTARFRDGYVGRAYGVAYAWTPRAVEVRFQHPDPAVRDNPGRTGAGYRVWLPAADVERVDAADEDSDEADTA